MFFDAMSCFVVASMAGAQWLDNYGRLLKSSARGRTRFLVCFVCSMSWLFRVGSKCSSTLLFVLWWLLWQVRKRTASGDE